jgi:hypothetical protein
MLPHQQIGWQEINEDFIRFTLLKTPWVRIYLHRLEADRPHPHCHDHPWSFVSLLLAGGYWERCQSPRECGPIWHWRNPGQVLYRPAEFKHNVKTLGVSWSLIFTGRKRRPWGFTEDCRNDHHADAA